MKNIIAIICIFFVTNAVFSQTGVIGYGSNAAIPTQMSNPALSPNVRFVVSVPFMSSVMIEQNNSFKLTDWLSTEGGKTYLSFDKFLTLSQETNSFNTNFGADLFNIGFRVKDKNFFSIGAQTFSSNYGSFSKDLIKLVAEGNANHSTITLNKESVYHTFFSDLFFGYSRSLIDNKLKIGAKLKIIKGQSHFQTDNLNFTLTTDPNSNPAYAINVTGSMQAQAGGIVGILTDTLLSPNSNDMIKKNFMGMGTGTGFDLGASYQVTPKLTLSASAINIGNITWKKEYATKLAITGSGKFNFTGIKVNINDGENGNAADSVQQAAKDAFKISQTKGEFSSALPTLIYFQAGYKFSDKHQLSAVFRTQSINKKSNNLLGLSYAFTPNRLLQLLGGVTLLDMKNPSLGAGIVFSPGPFQIHVLADNVSGLSGIDNTNRMQIQMGLNVVIKNKKSLLTKTIE
jgi:Family of unknown function (DUF5723)